MKKLFLIVLIFFAANVQGQTARALIGKDTIALRRDINKKSDSARNNAGVLEFRKNGVWGPQFTLPAGGGNLQATTALGNATSKGIVITDTAKLNFTPSEAGIVARIFQPTPYTGAAPFQISIASVANVGAPGTYNTPVVMGFNPYSSFDPTRSGNHTSMENNYNPYGLKFMEYHYEIMLPGGISSRLFSSTFIERSTLELSENQWDFRGTAFSIYPLGSTNTYASFGGNPITGQFTATFGSSNLSSGFRFQGNGTDAIIFVESLVANQTLLFSGWAKADLPDNITTKIITGGANGLFTTSPLNIGRTGSIGILNFNFDGATANKASISCDYGSGEFRTYAGPGGYYLTFFSNGTERMRITGAGKIQIPGNIEIGTADYADNAAAIAAGLTANTIYRTGSLLKIVF